MPLFNKNQTIFYVLLFLSIIPILLASPIVQNPQYHAFAEQRIVAAIPHIGDVISNLAFIIVGIVLWLQYKNIKPLYEQQQSVFLLFCISCIALGLGSGYYHWNPTNPTLFWDRLTMVLGFAVIFIDTSIKYGIFSTSHAVRKTLICMLLFIATTVIWIIMGRLEPYVFVQFFSMFVLVVLSLFNKGQPANKYLWGMFVFYAIAKLCEYYDVPIFEVLEVSGHTLKHLAYAGALYVFGSGMKQGKVLVKDL